MLFVALLSREVKEMISTMMRVLLSLLICGIASGFTSTRRSSTTKTLQQKPPQHITTHLSISTDDTTNESSLPSTSPSHRALLLGEWGGLQIPSPYYDNLTSRLKYYIYHLRQQDSTGQALRIIIQSHQLEIGIIL